MSLAGVFPELVADVEGALVRMGRGDLADRLREAPLAGWSRDDFAGCTDLHLVEAREPRATDQVVSLVDETGVSLEVDENGRLVRLEVHGYDDFLARLDDLRARPALFAGPGWRAVEMVAFDVPRLQAFCEANPEYFRLVAGAPPRAHQAREQLEALPPPEWPLSRKWMLLFVDEAGEVIGTADVLADLFAPGIWHVGFFVVATALHGTGRARAIYDALEGWMKSRGARWSRLGVVEANVRGERFWRRAGYAEVRQREDYPVDGTLHRLRVMAKPLGRADWERYFDEVPRDRPGAA